MTTFWELLMLSRVVGTAPGNRSDLYWWTDTTGLYPPDTMVLRQEDHRALGVIALGLTVASNPSALTTQAPGPVSVRILKRTLYCTLV
jgi:hypothetical protein